MQTKEGIECVLLAGTPFWERVEVKDMLAYLRLAATLSDEVALARIINTPARTIGAKSVEKLQAWADAAGQTLCAALFGTLAVRPRRDAKPIPATPYVLHIGASDLELNMRCRAVHSYYDCCTGVERCMSVGCAQNRRHPPPKLFFPHNLYNTSIIVLDAACCRVVRMRHCRRSRQTWGSTGPLVPAWRRLGSSLSASGRLQNAARLPKR